MPNLVPPITTIGAARAYRQRIQECVPREHHFTPLMTCYLTDETSRDELQNGFSRGIFFAAKLYPAGATTNASAGVTEISNLHGVLDRMQKLGMPLLIHGELVDDGVDIYDREAAFIDRELVPLRRDFPALKIVLEHVTTTEGVAFVREASGPTAATITPHHLVLNRNALLVGGIRPHLYCLPILKRERHRLALRAAVTSGDQRFFLGTDSAPHLRSAKEHPCGCAGVFNAPHALACYAQVFAEENALHYLEAFAALNGPRFYDLPPNEDQICLRRVTAFNAATPLQVGGEELEVFVPPTGLAWQVAAPKTVGGRARPQHGP